MSASGVLRIVLNKKRNGEDSCRDRDGTGLGKTMKWGQQVLSSNQEETRKQSVYLFGC